MPLDWGWNQRQKRRCQAGPMSADFGKCPQVQVFTFLVPQRPISPGFTFKTTSNDILVAGMESLYTPMASPGSPFSQELMGTVK